MRKKYLILIILLFLIKEGYSQISPSLQSKYPDFIGYKTTDFVQLTIQSGFTGPVNPYLVKNNFPSGNMGFDLSYRINREVALYSEFKYNFVSSKDSIFPAAGYFESTLGARYYVRPACCRSSLFFEAGFGPYVYFQGSSGDVQKQIEVKTYDPRGRINHYTVTTVTVNESPVYDSKTNLRFGANIGVGGELVLTNSLFLTIKTKLNTSFEANGNTSYITGVGGFTIRL